MVTVEKIKLSKLWNPDADVKIGGQCFKDGVIGIIDYACMVNDEIRIKLGEIKLIVSSDKFLEEWETLY